MPKKRIAEVAQHTPPSLSREGMIRGLMHDRRVTGKQVAERSGMSESMVSRVIRGLNDTPEIREALVEMLGVPDEVLFPVVTIAAAA